MLAELTVSTDNAGVKATIGMNDINKVCRFLGEDVVSQFRNGIIVRAIKEPWSGRIQACDWRI